MEKLEETQSICPECFKSGKLEKIRAFIIEEDGKVFIVKNCPEHGESKSRMFSDVKLYRKWSKFKVEGKGVEGIEIKSWLRPEDKLYDKHKSQTL